MPLSLSIIGPGRVGTAIGVCAQRAGWMIAAVGAREPAGGAAKAAGPAAALQAVARVSPAQAASMGELVLLTVPDDAIERVCTQLAEAGAFRRGAVVAHCSGALASDVLSAARELCSCAVGSMHPLQTFPTAEAGVERLAGTYCFIEGDERAAGALEELARAIGGAAMRIAPAAKALYHAAATMACNYLVALQDAAASLAASAGVDRAAWLAAAGPILRATVDNVLSMGPQRALTGPIVRGEAGTLERHAAALRAVGGDVRGLYATLGRYTVDLALRSGRIDAPAAEGLRKVLEGL